MKKLLSLKKFQKENQDAVLEKEILAEINGGMGGGPSSIQSESRETDRGWNCRDRERRLCWDNGAWSNWYIEWDEHRDFYGSSPYCC